jgi:cytochrome c peroxidase
MNSHLRYIPLLFFTTALFACTDRLDMEEISSPPHYYIPPISKTLQVSYFPQPERNPISKEGVALGEKLFFDPKLSSTGKVSCGSCHQPDLAFTDQMALGTHGVTGNKLHRNAPPLFNLHGKLADYSGTGEQKIWNP